MKKTPVRHSLIAVSALSVSIAVHLQAATFTSVQSGAWSDPLSWNVVAAGFPDVYGADSAIISATHVVNYDGSIPTIGGNLAVANGNSITINGGTLTQTWAPGAPPAFGTAIAIGVSGAVSGTGTLNLNAGGTFDSGTANAVVVGVTSSALGGAVGNGTVNVSAGTFLMGAASSAAGGQGLGIGIDAAAVGAFNLGDGVGAANTALLDLATNNALLTIGGRLAEATGGAGTLTIKADGRLNQGSAAINVGDNLGSGTLDVQGGTLQGGGGALNIGTGGGNGTLTLSGGLIDRVGANHDLVLGNGLGSTGVFTQSGGTLDLQGGHFQVGEGGAGTYNVTAGTVSNAGWIHVGSGVGSVGTVNVNFTNPADVLNTSALYVGNNGATGSVNVINGSIKSAGVVEVGRGNGTGTLNVAGSNSSVEGFTGGSLDGFFRVGMVGGHGIVNVTAGGKINTNGGWFTLGENNGSAGEATFSGTGTTLTSRGLIVGWNGLATGTLNITDNAVVTNTGHELSVGRDAGGANSPTGIINISSGGVLNAGPETRIGYNATGVVNIDGGTINMQGGAWAILGEGGAANGTLNMSAGTVNVTADKFVLGQNAGAVGTFNQTGGATDVGNEFNVGRGGATGTLNFEGGTFNVHGWTTIGRDGSGTGTINVKNGAVFTHAEIGGDLLLGWNGGSHGDVNITAGGKMTYNWWIRAGIDAGSTGHLVVDGTGSILQHNNGTGGDSRLVIGEAGTGTLAVGHSAQIIDGGNGFFVGWHNTGTGTANVSTGGGVAVNSGWVQVGIEAGSHGSLTVNGTGSTFSHDSTSAGYSTAIGQSGTGSLTISNGAVFDDTGSRFLVGRDNGGSGTLTVSGGSTLLHHPAVNPNAEDWMMVIGGTHEDSQPVGGTGLMIVTGGSVVQTNSIDIGRRSPGGGILNLTNSALSATGHFSTGRGTNGIGGSTNGLVNLTNATLQYGAWLSVGHEGGSGVLNITNSTITGNGDFNVGIDQNGAPSPTVGVVNMNSGTITVPTMPIGRSGGTGTFNLNSGTVTVNNEVNIGNGGSTTNGTLNISGPASTFNMEPTDGGPHFFVGRGGGHGIVNVANFGQLNTGNSWFALGNGDGSIGDATVSGAGSTLNSEGLIVGWNLSGVGHLTISNNGVVNNINHELSVGRDQPNTSGTVTINSGGTLNTIYPRIGHNGIGVVEINNGSLIGTAGDTIIGDAATADGTVTMSGNSTFRSADHFYVGNLGKGTYTQNGGNLDLGVNHRIQIGNQAGSTGTFNLTAGTVSVSQWIHIGSGAGSTGTLNVNYANPAGVLTTNDLYLGNGSGTGYANVTSGTLRMLNLAEVGRYGGTGTLNVSGANSNVEAFTNGVIDGFFKVGGQDASTGHGIVNVTAGGRINTNGGWFTLGQNSGSLGETTVSGTNSTLNSHGLIVGWNGSGTGTLNIENNAVVTNVGHEISIGRDQANTSGTVNISNGGTLNSIEPRIGHNGVGVVNMNGGTFNATGGWTVIGSDGGNSNGTVNMIGASAFNVNGGRVYVGRFGTGSLSLSDTSTFTHTGADQFNIGGVEEENGFNSNFASHGTVNVSDSAVVSTTNFIRVGHGNAGANPAVGTVNLSGGTINAGNWIGFGHESGDGTLNMTGGAITVNAELYVGVDDNGHTRTTTGTANISKGTISTGGLGFVVGRNGGNGAVNVTGTDPVTMTSNNETHIGQGGLGAGGNVGNGTLNFGNPNATLTVTNQFLVGQDGGIGVVNQTAGTVAETNQWLSLAVGGGSTGTYNILGGNVNANVLEVGADGTGVFNVSGTAQVIANAVTVGTRSTGNGTINISGGLFKSNDHIALGGDQSYGVGTLNMTGGVVQTNYVQSYTPEGGTAFLNMDGGTFRAGANYPDFLTNFNLATSEINAGGITFDTNGFNISVINPLDGAGSLTKTGNGTLILGNSGNVYGGGTTVSGGTLQTSTSGVIPDTSATVVNGVGAKFDLNGNTETVASIASVVGSTIALGGGTLTAGANGTSTFLNGATTGTVGSVLNKVGGGTLTINGAQSYKTLNANAGTTTLNSSLPGATINNNAGVLNINANANGATVNAHAITNIRTSQTLAALHVDAASLVTIVAHTPVGPANMRVVDTAALSFVAGGTIDVTNNGMIVRGSTLAAVNARIASGANAGPQQYWDGPGINSSTAANIPSGATAVGVLDNAEYGWVDGNLPGFTGLTGNEILVKYTWYGDTDLNGAVNGDDFSQFAVGFIGTVPAEWFNGDFDYNGAVNGDDFSLFAAGLAGYLASGQLRPADAAAWTQDLAQLAQQISDVTIADTAVAAVSASATASAPSAVGRAVVPEPGSITLLAVGALGLLARRRRNGERD